MGSVDASTGASRPKRVEGEANEPVPHDQEWRDWCSVAIIQFGLSKEEFFSLTPREYHALLAQHKLRIRHTELLHAITSATVTNTSMCAPEEPVPFTRFMPSEWSAQIPKTPRKKRMTKDDRDALNRKVHCFFAARSDNAPPRTPDAI